MDISQKLLKLRKEKNLSQEEAAEKLNVSRQTISKWETNQSTPDFDKLALICELYEITADELISGKEPIEKNILSEENKTKKKALGIGLGVLLYFISIIWIMISIPVFKMNPIVSSAIFLFICALATFCIIYVSLTCKTSKQIKDNTKPTALKVIEEIFALLTTIIYLVISFISKAWHITWIIWIIYALIMEIVKLIFVLKGEKYEE